jgi:hypothetical protein
VCGIRMTENREKLDKIAHEIKEKTNATVEK